MKIDKYYNMLKKSNLILVAILYLIVNLLTNTVISQTDNTYEDLLVMYVNEDFKNCYNKSLKYTLKDKTKKDPLPYLFVSKACYEMSQDHKYTEEFPKARKTALSYAVKYRKKDKENKFKEDSEEYINNFKLNIIEELENFLEEGTEKTYSKAVGLTKKTCDMDPDDFGAKLLYSILCTITKNKTYAKESLKICIPKLEEYEKNKFSLKYMTESQQLFLRNALMEYAKYYKEKDASKSKKMMEYGKLLFYEENDFSKIEYNMDYKFLFDDFK